MKSNRIFIVGVIITIILIFYYLFFTFKMQKEINNKLQANISAMQDQQRILINLLENVEFSNKEITKNLAASLIDYHYCFEKKSLGISNHDVLDAVQAVCMPSNIELVTEYSNANSIFLNCFIEKGIKVERNESTDHIAQQCVAYEKEVSKQIQVTIEKSNND
ncbi:MAG: Ca2+/Na+ antiporter [Colwellia sp.]|jgi:Ca2+/Na+ antiporter